VCRGHREKIKDKKNRRPREEDTQTQTTTSMFCGEEEVAEGGEAWKDGMSVFFSAREACLSVAGVGPRAGRSEIRSRYRYSTAQKSNVQSRLLNCKHGSQFFSVLFQLTFPSVIITNTNQPPLRPRLLIPRRRHCDLPNFGQRPAEGSPPKDARAGPEKVWHVIKLSPRALSPLRGPFSGSPPGRLTKWAALRYLPLS
jgi:hypothetical protein